MRILLRMERAADLPPPRAVSGIHIRSYSPERDHAGIPALYGAAFEDDPWPPTWDAFDEFDPDGAFVAETDDGDLAGFVIAFPRHDHGYISVVAVQPDHRRQGIATSLVCRAAEYLEEQGVATIRIDAFGDSPPAVATYHRLGFRVYDLQEDTADEEPTH